MEQNIKLQSLIISKTILQFKWGGEILPSQDTHTHKTTTAF